MFVDRTGDFPWLILGVIVLTTIAGGYLGSKAEKSLSGNSNSSNDLYDEPQSELSAGERAKNIVIDPVMVATSGSALSKESAIAAMREKLFPIATVITPNIPECEVLVGRKITSVEEMEQAAKELTQTYGCAFLCKGGHSVNDANDLLSIGDKLIWFNGKRIDNPNTHGTGCTLSSAIASNLAKGYSPENSVEMAKEYISEALSAMLDLGKGSGPMCHAFKGIYKSKFEE
jgi:hydroxymethylpyrimidine/phosphomethylpyrimidine kinase